MLESAEACELRAEGADDIVDFEVVGSASQRLRVCQAKTRKEPYQWTPAPLVEVIKRWQVLDNATAARFEFLTDGSVGQEVAERFQPALRRARKGELTDDDRAYLAGKGLDAESEVLGRVAIESRQPDADVTLDRVVVRLMRLLELGAQPADTQQAEALVNALFRLVSTRSGLPTAEERVVTRKELSGVVGVPLKVIDRAARWTTETEQAYAKAVRDDPPHASFVILQARRVSLQPDALAFVTREQAERADFPVPMSAVMVLEERRGAVVSGQAGAGKTTTLELLALAALDHDLVPVIVSVEGYEADALTRLIRGALERRLGSRLAPGATATLLRSGRAVVLLDGAGELNPEAREALIFDVQRLQQAHDGVRVIATSREARRLRALNLPGFVLQGLGPQQRRHIAAGLLGPSEDQLVASVEGRLGSLVDIPLLFVIALGLAKRGVDARNRVELFDGFVEGLEARPGGPAIPDIVTAALHDACFQLRLRDQYSADPWTWRRLLAAAIGALVQEGLFGASTTSADAALERATKGGLLRALPGSDFIALPHDLFCDFFAAESVRHGQQELPNVVGDSLEESAAFLAERNDMPLDRARRVVSNPVAAARCADALPIGAGADDADTAELYARMREHLGAGSRKALEGVHVRVAEHDDGTYVFVVPEGHSADAPLDMDALARQAVRTVRIERGSSSLTAALALWLAELRHALGYNARGELLAIPERRDEFPDALVQAFTERRGHLQALCQDACPTLAVRVLRELDLRGFHAVVLPANTAPLPIGGGDEFTYHLMAFSYNADDIDVRLSDTVDGDFIEAPSSSIACEDWLRDAPFQAALKDLRNALDTLLPGFAR